MPRVPDASETLSALSVDSCDGDHVFQCTVRSRIGGSRLSLDPQICYLSR
jgi:hypothetical protein